MNKVDILEELANIVPDTFKNLDADKQYRLTKTGSKRANWSVMDGDSVRGDLYIVPVLESYGIRVHGNGFTDYIRTSPVVKIVDATESVINFETEGGYYKLEVLGDN